MKTNPKFALCILLLLWITSCSKPPEPGIDLKIAGAVKNAKTSAQPLPGGKANFSLSLGRFATTGSTWVRMVNWTFNASAGTVNATYWQWHSSDNKGKTAYNSHTCTFDGKTKSCLTYTPTGWVYPSGQYTGWTGTYTYNTTTKSLVINWSNGHTETWTVSNPQTTIARVLFASSSYYITHGHGYGSNASWGTYVALEDIPKVSYGGYQVISRNAGNGANNVITPSTAGAWQSSALNLTPYTYPSSPTPKNAMHVWVPPGETNPCGTGGNPRTGIIYHLASVNNSRSMIWNHFCASLPFEVDFPCYVGNNHPYAFQQIIDDNGALKGFVGIEQQDIGELITKHQYQLKDYTTVPW